MSRVPKILSYLRCVDQGFNISRTDGGGMTGPHAVSIPDGDYVITGQRPGYIVTTGTDTILPVETKFHNHQIQPGDLVSLYRGGTVIYSDLVVTYADSSEIYLTQEVDYEEGDIVVVQDDLISWIYASVWALGFDQLIGTWGFEVNPDTGVVSYGTTAFGFLVTINGMTETLFDWLRINPSTPTLSLNFIAQTGIRCHAGGFYPSKVSVVDAPIKRAVKSSSVSTDGTRETLYAATHRLHRLTLRYQGGPRSTDYDEMLAIEDLWDRWVAQDGPARVYPDRTVLTPYQRVSNPWGWERWTVEGAPDWDPHEHTVVGGVYDWFDLPILLRHYAR